MFSRFRFNFKFNIFKTAVCGALLFALLIGFLCSCDKSATFFIASPGETLLSSVGVNYPVDFTERISAGILTEDTASASPPSVSAKSAILTEQCTGKIVFEKNADIRLPMASTTKIMTALIVIEKESANLDRPVTVSPDAVGVEGSSVYLYAGEKLTVRSLLYAVLLQSANDAAAALAIETAGSIPAFAALMNKRAEELGLKNTHFENPHGLDAKEHYTTAKDLAALAAFALGNDEFLKISSTEKIRIKQLNEGGETRLLVNHNKLLRTYEGAVGVKTGFTRKSGRCLVSAARRDGTIFVCVTLNASDDWNDHRKMLDFGFASYKNVLIADRGEITVKLPVVGGNTDSVLCVNECKLSALLPANHKSITVILEMYPFTYAPVFSGMVMGRLVCRCDGKTVAVSDVVATESIEKYNRRFSLFKKKR